MTRWRGATWDALFDGLLAEREQIASDIRRRIHENLPVYREIDEATLDRDIRLSFVCTIESARAGSGAVSASEVAALVEVGRSQAEAGVPLEDLLRAWRLGIEGSIAWARQLGTRLGAGDGEILEFVGSVLAWSDLSMVETARGHRLAELELAQRDHERRASFVRRLLAGTMLSSEIRVEADLYGIDATRTYVAVRARPLPGTSIRELERALGFDDARQLGHGLSAHVDDQLSGFIRDRPSDTTLGIVGVGAPRSLERLAESARLATRAFVTADSFELSGVQDIDSLGLRAAVAADWDVGDALCRRYLEPLAEIGPALDLANTLRTYLACGMHVDRAAEQLVVHPNTLRYRISRFEALTGSNLRDAQTPFEVWWALERAELRSITAPADLGAVG